jgi:hypothetical protein
VQATAAAALQPDGQPRRPYGGEAAASPPLSSQLESDDAADLTIDDSTVAAGRRKPEKKHMPTSLFSYFTGKLPPEGSTVTDEVSSTQG